MLVLGCRVPVAAEPSPEGEAERQRARGRAHLGAVRPPFLVWRVRPWRKRQDSEPVSMMWARWVRRSTTALARRGSGKTLVHSPNGRFVVTITEPRSWRP